MERIRMRRRYRSWLTAAALTAATSVAGTALLFVSASAIAASPVAASSRASGDDQIAIKNFAFAPASLTIKAGSTVTWQNLDDEPHTIVSDTGLFRSGAIDTHESFSFKFAAPGTYHFTCSIHPRMTGTVVVE